MNNARDRVVQLVGRGWDQVKGSLYRNAIFIMLTSVISSGLGFFFWLVIGNAYDKNDVGSAIVLFQTLGFIGTLGSLGIGVGLIRYLPETKDQTALVNAGLTISGVVTLVLGLAFLALLPLVLPRLRRKRRCPRGLAPSSSRARLPPSAGVSNRTSSAHPAILARQLCRHRDLCRGEPPPDAADLRRARTDPRTSERGLFLHRADRREPPLHHPGFGIHLLLRGSVPEEHGPPPRGAGRDPAQRRPPDPGHRRHVVLLRTDASPVWRSRLRGPGCHAAPNPQFCLDPRLHQRDSRDARAGPEADPAVDHLRDDRHGHHVGSRIRAPPESRPRNRRTRLCVRARPGRRDALPVLRGPRGVRRGPAGAPFRATLGVRHGHRDGDGRSRPRQDLAVDLPTRLPRPRDCRRDPDRGPGRSDRPRSAAP